MDDNGYYLYAITKDKGFSNGIVGGAGISPKHATGVIRDSGLAAIVSAVPLSEFGQESLAVNIQNLTWLEPRARVHDNIIRQLAVQATIVPVRFGTVYFTADSIRQLLANDSERLHAVLESLEGLWEMGVTLYFDKKTVVNEASKLDADVQFLQEKISQAGPGTSYLLERKLETNQARLAELVMQRQVAHAMEMLQAVSKAVKQGMLSPLPNDQNTLYVGLACLIDETQMESFKAHVESWKTEVCPTGVAARVTGPWPPYSFCSWDNKIS
ncbi:MAG: GvpL/GvpF family gas vesicle protein [Candidatus Melainabacteria bacterium]|nr:GvpL/GvpF family gas vesicle protein [Candidatus Melainabacteria bacterium]